MSSDGIKNTSDLEGDRHLMDLYSRQIGAFGMEAMVKLVQMRVLFIGVTGVGIEAAKNTTLAGAHTVALLDSNPVEMRDLGSNFFLTEADIGSARAAAVAPRLAELNPLVRVQAVDGEIDVAMLHKFDAVVVTDKSIPKEQLIRWNDICRSRTRTVTSDRGEQSIVPNPTSFIYCFTGGVFGSTFVDHGDSFVVRDQDGKEPLLKIIKSIEQRHEEVETEDGSKVAHHYTLIKFLTPDGQPPGSLPENCLIELTDIEGMVAKSPEVIASLGSSVVTAGPWRTSSKPSDPVNSVRIGDTRGFTPYTGGGFLKQVKEPTTLSFRPLAQCISQPSNLENAVVSEISDYGFLMIDLMSMFSPGGIEVQIHFALNAVFSFVQENGRLPAANSTEDADACVLHARKMNDALRAFAQLTPGAKQHVLAIDNIDESVVRKFALHAAVELQPMCAFFGGVVAQELVKISGRYRPIRQFFNFHVMQALPDEAPTDTAPVNSRYDDQIAVFGKAFQDRLCSLNIFMVGCGALGCEFMKNFALMGVCAGDKGKLLVTDNDRIEISNLSRQFLFREDNVGQPKSEAASKRAKLMNPAINIDARQDLVSPDTEHIFNDDMWQGLDLVCNALDNMKARIYVDSKCVLYEKPLLESGTMGTGANVDVIVPHVTLSYSDGGDAEEGGGIPMCTLRNFPHLIDHCIEWARAKFTDLFVSPATQLQQFLESPASFLDALTSKVDQHVGGERTGAVERAVDTLRSIKALAQELKQSPTMETCVQLAWRDFHVFFRDAILDLIATFPADAKTKSGEPFWSGHKLFPQAVAFDPKNELHRAFLTAAANLYACVFKVHPEKYPSEENKLHANRWMHEYRSASWLNGAVSGRAPPTYVRHHVDDLDDEAKESAEHNTASAPNENTGDSEAASDAHGNGTGVAMDEAADDGEAEKAEAEEEDPEEAFSALKEELMALCGTLADAGVAPLDFEKDDDDNFHIDFITAAANLRATNYRIPTATRHKCKMIAGRIIPAIATSTASVTGLVMMELYKLVQKKPLESYRNANYNLGANTYFFFEPPEAKKIKGSTSKMLDSASYEASVNSFNKFLGQAETKLMNLRSLLSQLEEFDGSSDDTKAAVTKAIEAAEAELAAVQETAPEVDDFMVEEKTTCYPETFTKWDKLTIPSNLATFGEVISFLKEKHKLDVSSWFINKRKVYPVQAALDVSKLPPLDMSINEAMRHIMKVGGRQTNALIQAWRRAKSSGVMPEPQDEKQSPVNKPLLDLVRESGADVEGKRVIVFEDVVLTNEDGEEVTTPPIIMSL